MLAAEWWNGLTIQLQHACTVTTPLIIYNESKVWVMVNGFFCSHITFVESDKFSSGRRKHYYGYTTFIIPVVIKVFNNSEKHKYGYMFSFKQQ